MASIYMEKAEALNAETLEKNKIERIARMLRRKEEETVRHERALREMDAEIKRLEEATITDFENDCCREECLPRAVRF